MIVSRTIIQGQLAHIARGTWQAPDQLPASSDVSSESAKLLMTYQTQMIVRLAMLEGAGFFGLVAYLLEGHWLALGVGSAALRFCFLNFQRAGGWRTGPTVRMAGCRKCGSGRSILRQLF